MMAMFLVAMLVVGPATYAINQSVDYPTDKERTAQIKQTKSVVKVDASNIEVKK